MQIIEFLDINMKFELKLLNSVEVSVPRRPRLHYMGSFDMMSLSHIWLG